MSAVASDRFDPAQAMRQAAAELAKDHDAEAEALLRRALEGAADHPGLLQYLGIVRVRRGDPAEAESLLRRAVALNPGAADHHLNLGNVLDARGEPAGAADCFRRALAINPSGAAAHSNLGNELTKLGRRAEALAAYRRAVAIKPGNARYRHNLALALYELGRFAEAEDGFRRAIEADPGYAEAHHNLGLALESRDKLEDAAASYRRTVALDPRHANAMTNLGNVLLALRRPEEAAEMQRRAIAIEPELAEAHTNLGAALFTLNRYEEAEAAHRRALELKPGLLTAQKNLGVLLEQQGRVEEGMALLEQAVRGGPIEARAEAHFAISLLLLRHGEFKRGWAAYEWRKRVKDYRGGYRDFGRPQWRGEEIKGRGILLHAEQGNGDTIQFARYAPMVAARGARVFLEVQPALKRVCASLAGVERVLANGEALPDDFQFHCPLLSLPHACGTELSTVPADVPYLGADAGDAERWKRRFAAKPRPAVGIVWAGNPEYKNDHNRSMDPALLAPLFAIKDISFYALQVGPAADQLAKAAGGERVERLAGELRDFADTAAAIEGLDLVIAVDTAVAHLAGALGKPVWILLPRVADFRWLVDRADTPWYPSARLFRQQQPGDWAKVIERVRGKLASRAIGR